jgi:hypothetical protein
MSSAIVRVWLLLLGSSWTAGLLLTGSRRACAASRVSRRSLPPLAGDDGFRKQGFSSPSWQHRQVTPGAAEAKVDVRPAGPCGMGAFAAEPITTGTWIGSYVGLLTTREETDDRYSWEEGDTPDYLFTLSHGEGLEVDAENSTHFSRYINHHENGTLHVQVSAEERSIEFFAACDVGVGEELTFDCAPPRPPRRAPSGQPP